MASVQFHFNLDGYWRFLWLATCEMFKFSIYHCRSKMIQYLYGNYKWSFAALSVLTAGKTMAILVTLKNSENVI